MNDIHQISRMTARILCTLYFVFHAALGAEDQWVVSAGRMDVPFISWQADGAKVGTGVLVLIPGYNGKGEQMLDARWKAFATKHGLVLLAPTFRAEGKENNEGKGYYYPEQGSGEVMEKALKEVGKRTGAETDQVLFFGFSAGAHFTHRFALWKPQRVKAFVAYSAGWWSEPTAQVRKVPALLMCGETDERYAATWEFFKKGQRLGCPWVWRSYAGTGHVLTPAVRDMAEVFLAHYVGRRGQREEQAGMPVSRFGDIQTFQTVNRAARDSIPEEFRIELPSKEVAEVWEKEDGAMKFEEELNRNGSEANMGEHFQP
jgi:pimeloyl-ACP methyl ester carboxylesterase